MPFFRSYYATADGQNYLKGLEIRNNRIFIGFKTLPSQQNFKRQLGRLGERWHATVTRGHITGANPFSAAATYLNLGSILISNGSIILQCFLEGIVRGYKSGILTAAQYNNLTQCETLEDFRMQLSATDYGNFLANEPLPLSTSTIADKATQILVDQFNYLRNNSVEPLSTFFDYMTYAYMIDNVILLITGTLHERDTHELLERCHPLGVFDTMPALCVATNVEELYNSVLVETPLAPYFRECLSASDLDDLNIEIIRNTLYKAYLEDFNRFCDSVGGPTGEVMHQILAFEADRRTINITINSFNTDLSKEQRAKLFPSIGHLFPAGNNNLAKADDLDQVKAVCDNVALYRSFFDSSGVGSGGANGGYDLDEASVASKLEERFFSMEVHFNKLAFLQQFQYGVFYSYVKLKEQEIRNITWIAECIAQEARDRMQDYITIF